MPEVVETGNYPFITEFPEKGKYPFVSVKNRKELGHGNRGVVYELSDEKVVKVFFKGSTIEGIKQEKAFTHLFHRLGIPCADAYEVVETENGYGVVFERAGHSSLGSFIHAHWDEMENRMTQFSNLAHAVHNITVTDELLPNLFDYKKLYKSELTKLTDYFSKRDISSMTEMIDAIPDTRTLLHGDCHPENSMLDEQHALQFIDIADAGYGHPIFDVGGFEIIIYTVKGKDWKAMNLLGMTDAEAQKIWDIFLRKYYATNDEKTIKYLKKTFSYFAMLRMALLMATPTIDLTDTEKKLAAQIIKLNLILHKRDVIKRFSAI